MPLATVDDVAARIGRPVAADETARVSAFLLDVTGLVEDYCGRDMDRRAGQSITLYPEGGSALPVPLRYQTFLTVAGVLQDGQAVTDYRFNGRALVRDSDWGESAVTLTASWGYESVPAALRAVACSEVIRWLALSPGVESERVGEVEVTFSGASSAQTLSTATRTTLRPYRRQGAGSITLRREGPALDLRGPVVL
ncbi:phage gp6-like head-tail connector protein [Streptomyces sp. ISL-87]|uniref:phage gp6-like head-tail connector protein n=1 Tax=Streptomyces sp. ISL-87 TaxID=2819188 RepID=UPI001BE8720A|nr:phage gp6-like head-tail connector protein [Streptomyces sp. ISL-87]MBT2609881.1 phage gp6-like head-tail connector protein [Streptomyces sp. ISL-87]